MQKGPSGNQKPHIRITTDFDGEWMDQLNNPSPEIKTANENDQSSTEGMYWSSTATRWMNDNSKPNDEEVEGYFAKLPG